MKVDKFNFGVIKMIFETSNDDIKALLMHP